MYKFKDLGVYRDLQTDQLRLAVISKKDSHHEALFVEDGRVMPFEMKISSIGCHTNYFDPSDARKWTRYQRNSVMERLLGISFEDDQEFSLDNLRALEQCLNTLQKQAYQFCFEVTRDGTGDLAGMKKGDLLFTNYLQDDTQGYIHTESNGRYSIVQPYHDKDGNMPFQMLLIAPTGVKEIQPKDLPHLDVIRLTNGENEYGVFPDRSMYLDTNEYLWFTADAYKKFLAKQKESETDDSNDKN